MRSASRPSRPPSPALPPRHHHQIITKSSKYSLFDPAKEMVYISMERGEKAEGKASVDLLASYFGKSGASWLTQV